MSKKANDALRAQWVSEVMNWLRDKGEDMMQVSGNEVAFPVVDSEGEDNCVVITVKIPSGSRDGEAYDLYGLAQEYQMKQADKQERAKRAAEEKARKIARDKAMREQKAESKAKREQSLRVVKQEERE